MSQNSIGQFDGEGLGIPGSVEAKTLPHSGQLRGGIPSVDGRPVGSVYPIKFSNESFRPPGSSKKGSSQKPKVIQLPLPQGYDMYMKDKLDEKVQMNYLEEKMGKGKQSQEQCEKTGRPI